MSYGKEIFRGKYKETMDSLNIIKDNYYDLDQEYQCSMKEKNKEIERLNNIINKAIKGIEDFYYGDEEYKKYDYTLAYQIYHILKGEDKE